MEHLLAASDWSSQAPPVNTPSISGEHSKGSFSRGRDALFIQNHAVKVLRKFCTENTTHPQFENLAVAEMDQVLSLFYKKVRKADDTYFTPNTMKVLKYGLKGYLKNYGVDITDSATFPLSTESFKGRIKELRIIAPVAERAVEMTYEDIVKVFESNALNPETPQGLYNLTFFLISHSLICRGRKMLHAMTKTSFEVKMDQGGRKYIGYKEGGKGACTCSKCIGKSGEQFGGRRLYEKPGLYYDPVQNFIKYLSHLNPHCDSLWQRPFPDAARTPQGAIWYRHTHVGQNSISTFMQRLSRDLKLSKVYGNGSIRKISDHVLDGVLITTSHKKKAGLISKHLPLILPTKGTDDQDSYEENIASSSQSRPSAIVFITHDKTCQIPLSSASVICVAPITSTVRPNETATDKNAPSVTTFAQTASSDCEKNDGASIGGEMRYSGKKRICISDMFEAKKHKGDCDQEKTGNCSATPRRNEEASLQTAEQKQRNEKRVTSPNECHMNRNRKDGNTVCPSSDAKGSSNYDTENGGKEEKYGLLNGSKLLNIPKDQSEESLIRQEVQDEIIPRSQSQDVLIRQEVQTAIKEMLQASHSGQSIGGLRSYGIHDAPATSITSTDNDVNPYRVLDNQTEVAPITKPADANSLDVTKYMYKSSSAPGQLNNQARLNVLGSRPIKVVPPIPYPSFIPAGGISNMLSAPSPVISDISYPRITTTAAPRFVIPNSKDNKSNAPIIEPLFIGVPNIAMQRPSIPIASTMLGPLQTEKPTGQVRFFQTKMTDPQVSPLKLSAAMHAIEALTSIMPSLAAPSHDVSVSGSVNVMSSVTQNEKLLSVATVPSVINYVTDFNRTKMPLIPGNCVVTSPAVGVAPIPSVFPTNPITMTASIPAVFPADHISQAAPIPAVFPANTITRTAPIPGVFPADHISQAATISAWTPYHIHGPVLNNNEVRYNTHGEGYTSGRGEASLPTGAATGMDLTLASSMRSNHYECNTTHDHCIEESEFWNQMNVAGFTSKPAWMRHLLVTHKVKCRVCIPR